MSSKSTLSNALSGWLMASPLAIVLALFLVLPIAMIVVVSFWGATEFSIYPAFIFDNYEFLFRSSVTYSVYLKTFMFTIISWALCLAIGFTVAYFLAFHIRTQTWQIVLFLVCTVPFLTSNIIRMISWVPFLGRNGIANQTLISMGMIDEPLEWLLFSDFAVVLAFVHLYTLFMVVPIFNTMMRIDKSLLEAARDAGATGLPDTDQCHPAADQAGHHDRLDLRRHAGDGRLHHRALHESGSQSANVGRLISNDVALLNIPPRPRPPLCC
jgi:putative spermidine/putrescine transport system permease protein